MPAISSFMVRESLLVWAPYAGKIVNFPGLAYIHALSAQIYTGNESLSGKALHLIFMTTFPLVRPFST